MRPKRIQDHYPGFEQMPEAFVELTPEEEAQFQKWYSEYAAQVGVNPSPDEPQHLYNYRAWWKAQQLDPKAFGMSEDNHAPSLFKHAQHPNRYVPIESGGILDSITGTPLINPIPNEMAPVR